MTVFAGHAVVSPAEPREGPHSMLATAELEAALQAPESLGAQAQTSQDVESCQGSKGTNLEEGRTSSGRNWKERTGNRKKGLIDDKLVSLTILRHLYGGKGTDKGHAEITSTTLLSATCARLEQAEGKTFSHTHTHTHTHARTQALSNLGHIRLISGATAGPNCQGSLWPRPRALALVRCC